MNLDELPWTVIEARGTEGVVIFRRRHFPEGFPKSSLPHRLNIFWQASPSSSGLPAEQDSNAMREFEDRLVSATEHDLQSVLSLVLTGKNMREFVFHTNDTEVFLQRLTEMPQEEDPYPITIQHTVDPDWEYVGRVLADIKYEE